MARKRNPNWTPVLLIASLAAIGTLVYAGTTYARSRNKAVEQDAMWWIRELNAIMPPDATYPGGYDIEDVGFYDSTVGANYKFAWRILKLRQPVPGCDPSCNYVVVATGQARYGRNVDGFWPTATLAQAQNLLQEKHAEVT